MKIFLIGLPGSGKTTLGIQLAKELELELIDLDANIESKRNTSIPQIFENEGESQFRIYEKEALHEALSQNDSVISTGGGAPCFFDNMDVMNKHGITIFIDVSSNELIRRMYEGSQNDRPLLANKTQAELKIELEDKKIARLPFYKKAAHRIIGDNISVEQLLAALKQ